MRKYLSEIELQRVKEWVEAGILLFAGRSGKYQLGEAIILTCSEHVTHDHGLYATDSIVIAVNSGAAKLEPREATDFHDEAIRFRFLLDQIYHASKTACFHCPAFPVVLIIDTPCHFADDETIGIVKQLDTLIRVRNYMARSWTFESERATISCLVRVAAPDGIVFYRVDHSKWDVWYTKYEIDVLGRSPTTVDDIDDETTDELVDIRR